MQRMTAHFSGMVQGVGFRYTACRLAARYPQVTGAVRNLPDRRVELVAEGPDKDLRALLRDIRDAMADYIREVDTAYSPAAGKFRDFSISYGSNR